MGDCAKYTHEILAVRSDVLQHVALRLLLECDTEVLGDEKVFRKQLLSFSGHRAVALADLIQYVSAVSPTRRL